MSNRSFTISRDEDGVSLLDWLRERLSLSRNVALDLLHKRQVRVGGAPCLEPRRRLLKGQRVEVHLPENQGRSSETPRRQRPLPDPVIRFADEHVVVVDKPPGLTTMRHAEEVAEFGPRARRFLPPSLADLLPPLLDPVRPCPVRAVHRIDNETSGLVVFARTVEAERHLGQQFRAHSIERLYLALVRGKAVTQRVESSLARDRGDGRRGSSPEAGKGQHAVTHVRLIEELGQLSLVECRLETGRTHQVRIHLGEVGTPLAGERVYDRPPHGKAFPDNSGASRIMLHAATLGLDHPATGERFRFTSPLPRDMDELLNRLRTHAASSLSDAPPGS
jgi:23S rRNA pseudouridine1911/1915/1917 synthase